MTGITTAVVAGGLLVGAGNAAAQIAPQDLPSEHWSAGIDAGFADKYDDSGMWTSGYAAGVSGYYSLATTLLAGGRFGVAHWGYDAYQTEREIVPEGGVFMGAKSSGQTEVVEFGAFLRAERPYTLPLGFGVSATVSAQLDFVKHFAHSETVYGDVSSSSQVAIYDLNESDWRFGLIGAVGLGRPLTEQSIIEVFPWYRIIFEGGEVTEIPGISLGWRVRV